MAEQRDVLTVDEVALLEHFFAFAVALLKEDVVVDWQVGQEGAQAFEVGLWLEDDVLVRVEKRKVVVVMLFLRRDLQLCGVA